MKINPTKLLLAAIVLKKAHWQALSGDGKKGEVCVNGLRYFCELDKEGIPIMSRNTITQLQHVLSESISGE